VKAILVGNLNFVIILIVLLLVTTAMHMSVQMSKKYCQVSQYAPLRYCLNCFCFFGYC